MRCNKESVSTPTHDILSPYTILNIKTTESETLSSQGRGLNTTLYEYLILATTYQERLTIESRYQNPNFNNYLEYRSINHMAICLHHFLIDCALDKQRAFESRIITGYCSSTIHLKYRNL